MTKEEKIRFILDKAEIEEKAGKRTVKRKIFHPKYENIKLHTLYNLYK